MLVYLFFAGGLAMLMLGGEWLVRGAVAAANRLSVPPLIIGLTIVAFGTSAPELVISIDAALVGSGGIAVGNVVGSNIANVLLVLGIPAMIASVACVDKGLKTNITFLIGLTAAFMIVMVLQPIGRLDGLMLIMCLCLFLVLQLANARSHQRNNGESADAAALEAEMGRLPKTTTMIALCLLAGLVTLPLAAMVTVDMAVEIARRWSLSDEIIGLTIIAIGTSLPELATGITAARHGDTSVAFGNVIGSNLFNIGAIMGITALVAPVPVSDHIIRFDMWVMLATTALLIALPLLRLTIGRVAGALLVIAYCLYLVATAMI